MSRTRLIFTTLLITCLIWSAASGAGQGVSIGSPALDFKLPDLNGKQFKSSQLKGSIVVLDLWATWCEPCVADIRCSTGCMKSLQPRSQSCRNRGLGRVGKDGEGCAFRDGEYRQEVPRPFNTSNTFGFTTLMGLPAA